MTQAEALAQLEQRLQSELNATGKTYAEKVQSLQARLPAPLVKQLLELPTLQGGVFVQKLTSSHKQLGFFAALPTQPTNPEVWDEARRSQARANIADNLPTASRKKPSLNERLQWWLYETKRSIAKKAHAESKRWRLPMTLISAAIGAYLGWTLWGYGGALLSSVVWAGVAFWGYSEQNLTRAKWWQISLLEQLLKVLRGALVLVLLLLGLALVVGLAWLVLRFWGSR